MWLAWRSQSKQIGMAAKAGPPPRIVSRSFTHRLSLCEIGNDMLMVEVATGGWENVTKEMCERTNVADLISVICRCQTLSSQHLRLPQYINEGFTFVCLSRHAKSAHTVLFDDVVRTTPQNQSMLEAGPGKSITNNPSQKIVTHGKLFLIVVVTQHQRMNSLGIGFCENR